MLDGYLLGGVGVCVFDCIRAGMALCFLLGLNVSKMPVYVVFGLGVISENETKHSANGGY